MTLLYPEKQCFLKTVMLSGTCLDASFGVALDLACQQRDPCLMSRYFVHAFVPPFSLLEILSIQHLLFPTITPLLYYCDLICIKGFCENCWKPEDWGVYILDCGDQDEPCSEHNSNPANFQKCSQGTGFEESFHNRGSCGAWKAILSAPYLPAACASHIHNHKFVCVCKEGLLLLCAPTLPCCFAMRKLERSCIFCIPRLILDICCIMP